MSDRPSWPRASSGASSRSRLSFASSRHDADFIDVDVPDVLAQHSVPGCSVAVLDDGELVFERAYGTSRVESGTPMTRTTRLQACSMSKPVAVLAALRLVEQGVLDLDADVSDYLTRWTFPAMDGLRPRVTLRQLASHTSGLAAHPGFPGYPRGSELPTLVQVLSGTDPANVSGASLEVGPDGQYRYSGAGTSVIQLVLEEVTGAGAAELLARLVLEPLGMRASSFAQDPPDIDPDERAHGHLPDSTPVPGGWRVQPELCAAGLWTTPGDYLRLMRGVQRAYDSSDGLIAGSSARALLEPRAVLPTGPDMTGMTHIGLGFHVTAPDGATSWFGHTGSNVGFLCASVASVHGQHGAVVMFNSDNGAPAARSLLQSIARARQWSDLTTHLAAVR